MEAHSFSDFLEHSLIPASAPHGDGVFFDIYHYLKLAKIWEDSNLGRGHQREPQKRILFLSSVYY